MALADYARKRDFKKTGEPGAVPGRSKRSHRFVIQKHAASHLHYDFRLEMDGVLKSWAVPKGIPIVKGERRLAIEVEDHPVSYIDFEGTIPKGQYGGGTVMVWDRGVFTCDAKDPVRQLNKGKFHFTLEGTKLKGAWNLVRMRDTNQWLIMKRGDSHKPISAKADDTSAASGKSMKQLARNGDVWQSDRSQKQVTPRIKKVPLEPLKNKPTNSRRALPFIEPMRAQLADNVPTHGEWIAIALEFCKRHPCIMQLENGRPE